MGFRRSLMLAGFAAALCGDWMLAVKGSPSGSGGFLVGVLAFSLAHIFWMAAHFAEARPDMRVALVAGVPLVLFAGVRLAHALPLATGIAVVAYAAITAFDLATAAATRRRFYVWGVALLAFSDLMIGMRLLHAPGCGVLVGPSYIAAELCLLVSFFRRNEGRIAWARVDVGSVALWTVALALGSFVLAMATYPGRCYNPFLQMLSALGRNEVRMVAYPLCHFLFMSGMAVSAVGVARMAAGIRSVPGFTDAAVRAFRCGAVVNAAGLATIALVPENVNMMFHNAGCWLAAGGGAMMLFSTRRGRGDIAWRIALLCVVGVFGACLALNAIHVLPFSPWVTATQKLLITSFMAWMVALTVPAWRRRTVALACVLAACVAALGLFAWRHGGLFGKTAGLSVCDRWTARSMARQSPDAPFSDDEHAALRWLDHVTGPLPPEEEREWWHIGGSQHGLFAKRYNIAFCGYAAAALGMRGGERERTVAARILGNCIDRYLKREVWAYSMSADYWGRKPWAPDPCYRENVMYTGHLLQLLALYETFTGDTRYWTAGFDFVWKDGRRVHYTVKRLIDVTVHQMRKGPNGGVTCEPGLMFFPCNNHPHIAFALFSKLGHGDWTKEARRWERWSLANYVRPALGGGALNLLYHVQSGIMVPRGHGGLDGWALLWYEPWAKGRASALALWREAARRIDWHFLETGADAREGGPMCCNPVDVPPVPTASFLAAAARACDDSATAERLERIIDASLVRRDGWYYLDVGRDWRIGSTAIRIISLVEEKGFSFRDMLQPVR